MTLATPEQALARALQYTGYDKLEGYSKASVTDVKLVMGHEEKTPFVSNLINDKPVWSITFKNMQIESERQIVNRNVEVTLDPMTGKLLQIVSVADGVGGAEDSIGAFIFEG